MQKFGLRPSVPESLPYKKLVLVKVEGGFRWYIGNKNNVPVPDVGISQAELEAYTPPIKVVSSEKMKAIEDSTDITQDPTIYMIKNEG